MMKRINAAVAANPADDQPVVASSAYVDPSARVIGKVEIGSRVLVGPHAVIRADEMDASGNVAPIVIGSDSNVQDGVIVHSLAGQRVSVGTRVSLSHGCIVHGPCTIGDRCFIGFRAIVFKSSVGAGTYVGTGAIVEGVELLPDTLVPAGSVVNSAEAVSRLSKTGAKEQDFMNDVVEMNMKLAEGYLRPRKAVKQAT
ncbi:MAG: carbonate dehydratase [Candidatus Abyssobacteria bacterium SURF_5]|uniref:Carbonate dehydratase n=1 Tax=Abyssobacteria bacterium (strain SURF_5) TaxID=2093360 RepID=A0A3A4P136_ABYX5|nr:MAG: carbonate dehydratase [Candidatus Abyssubacteria bacterium SURF_5]